MFSTKSKKYREGVSIKWRKSRRQIKVTGRRQVEKMLMRKVKKNLIHLILLKSGSYLHCCGKRKGTQMTSILTSGRDR